MKRSSLFALMLSLAVFPQQAWSQQSRSDAYPQSQANAAKASRLPSGLRNLVEMSNAAGQSSQGDRSFQPLVEGKIVNWLYARDLTEEDAAALWAYFGDLDNANLATLPVIKAMLSASRTPKSREPLWSELAGLQQAFGHKKSPAMREQSLLALFEHHRQELLPLVTSWHETNSSFDEIIRLMLASRVFGADLDESIAYVSERDPAPLARYIEHERERGRPVRWEYKAFEGMVRWKNEHLGPDAVKASRSLDELDADGEAFIAVFNALHAVNDGFREVFLRGLGPVDLYNAVVAGEKELYRLGTSGYRGFLHDIIMQGVKESGSFEAFLTRAAPASLGDEAVRASARRGLVFLRVASSFGLLEPVLPTVQNRDLLIDEAINSLGDARSFEGNSAVLMDILTARSESPAVLDFKRTLLDRLYQRYRAERKLALQSVYGSMLSVYQAVTGDHRDGGIDRDFALSETVFHVPFDRLFSPDGNAGFVHRMFMRFDEDEDAVTTYENFLALMVSLGATQREEDQFDVFCIAAPGRKIEIYVNKPSVPGLRYGIANIADALRGRRIETVIGRGHTSIIAPLQADAKRLLGHRIKDVAVVMVGSCGGDTSVRELISTFGYQPFLTTKSTGRRVINDRIIKSYITALMSLAPSGRLSITEVLEHAVAPFSREGADEGLREDASLYQVNMTSVFSALLFDTHVRHQTGPDRRFARD